MAKEQFVIDRKGKKTGVLLFIDRYEQLVENLHDLAAVAEQRKKKPNSLQDLKKRLKKYACL